MAPSLPHLAGISPPIQVAGTKHAGGEGSAVHARAVAELGAKQRHHGVLQSVRAVGCRRQTQRWRDTAKPQGTKQGPRRQSSKKGSG